MTNRYRHFSGRAAWHWRWRSYKSVNIYLWKKLHILKIEPLSTPLWETHILRRFGHLWSCSNREHLEHLKLEECKEWYVDKVRKRASLDHVQVLKQHSPADNEELQWSLAEDGNWKGCKSNSLGTEFGALHTTAIDPGCMSQFTAFFSLFTQGSPFSMPQHSIRDF
jgi:hypothetical protein